MAPSGHRAEHGMAHVVKSEWRHLSDAQRATLAMENAACSCSPYSMLALANHAMAHALYSNKRRRLVGDMVERGT